MYNRMAGSLNVFVGAFLVCFAAYLDGFPPGFPRDTSSMAGTSNHRTSKPNTGVLETQDKESSWTTKSALGLNGSNEDALETSEAYEEGFIESDDLVDYNNYCYAPCFCTAAFMTCKKPDSIAELGKLVDPDPDGITEISIENQSTFKTLRFSDLEQFTGLERLTISRSGLEWIEEDAFYNNEDLQYLDLQGNRLKSFSWKLTQYIGPLIFLQGNPLECNCSISFLGNSFSETETDDVTEGLTCVDQSGNEWKYVEYPGFEKCEPPKAVLVNTTTFTHGPEVVITCRGEPWHDPDLKVNWERADGQRMGEEVGMRVISRSEVELSIWNITTLSSGSYFCTAENEVGLDSKQWNIIVESAPVVVSLTELSFHPDVALRYEVVGFPEPSLLWFRDGFPISFEDNNTDIVHARIKNEKPYLLAGTLRLRAPMYTVGNYTIVATNKYGSVNRTRSVIADPDSVGPPIIHGGNAEAFKSLNKWDSQEGRSKTGQATSLKAFLIVLGTLVPVLVVVIAVLVVRYKKPSSFHAIRDGDWKNRRHSSSSKRGKGGCGLEMVRRNRLAAFCLSGSQGDRPVCREHIPLSNDHVVENPNYEKTDDSLGDRAGFGFEGVVNERCHPGLPPVPVIPSNQIECLQELGEGAFGLVYLGALNTSDPVTKELVRIPVAIKTVKDCQLENNRRDFDREATMLAGLKHRNIVTFYGVATDQQPHMIVLEYMVFGDLCNFLRTNGPDSEMLIPKFKHPVVTRPLLTRPLTSHDLLKIAVQIAEGAAYLAQQHFVHRDLATRNCLVGADLVVKIGDFGMSRDIYATDYYKVGSHLLMPVRWMPPESIVYRTFSVESDVWSFGVVLWEIYSHGKQPWYELSNNEVIQEVQHGTVMSRPSECPAEVYRLMLRCWHKNPRERIAMDLLFAQLNDFLQHSVAHPHQLQSITNKQNVEKIQQQKPPTYLELIDN